ncbi:MAG: nucleoside deaminase [Granulosicoccaceae bacterium]
MPDVNDLDRRHMRRAIELSREMMEANQGGPFGAVITRGETVVAEGFNQVTSSFDPTAHAEVSAIRAACQAEQNFSLEGCTIYTSCEPCPMCLAAIYWARISRIVYANSRSDAAEIGFDDDFLYNEIPLPIDQRSIPMEQTLAKEALSVFQAWNNKADKTPY